MSTEVRSAIPRDADGFFAWDPAWDRAREFPVRIPCTEEEYLTLDENILLEYADGFLEVLPMPTTEHQRIVAFLYRTLFAWVTAQGLGEVLFAPLKVRLRTGKFREPDVLFLRTEHAHRAGNQFWERPDIVMEIVSESNRRHDLVTKRDEYARAGIPEYWIVDPEEESITIFVLRPRRKTYVEHGTFRKGERAESKLLPDFGIDVTGVFSQRPGAPR
jgi:Uma2 family endonuclease